MNPSWCDMKTGWWVSEFPDRYELRPDDSEIVKIIPKDGGAYTMTPAQAGALRRYKRKGTT